MGEMAYPGSPTRGPSSISYIYGRASSETEDAYTVHYQTQGIGDIEDDLALIRQIRREQESASDEDTEDASETDQQKQEDEYLEMKEQIFRDKLAYLKQQLEQLEKGTHPDFLRKLKKMEAAYKDRLLLNDVWRDYENQRADEEYQAERRLAVRDFEEKKMELRENLIAEFEDKKRGIENERMSIELTGDAMEVKPVTTRKLRRRPHDPGNSNISNVSEKRRKLPPTQLTLLLDENDVVEDLRAISRGTGSISGALGRNGNSFSNAKRVISSHGASPVRSSDSDNTSNKLPATSTSYGGSSWNSGSFENTQENAPYEARVEDGKLFYERRWYHRGQTVQVEGKKARFAGVICAISSEAITIRRPADSNKVKISVWQLSRGKYTLKRKVPP